MFSLNNRKAPKESSLPMSPTTPKDGESPTNPNPTENNQEYNQSPHNLEQTKSLKKMIEVKLKVLQVLHFFMGDKSGVTSQQLERLRENLKISNNPTLKNLNNHIESLLPKGSTQINKNDSDLLSAQQQSEKIVALLEDQDVDPADLIKLLDTSTPQTKSFAETTTKLLDKITRPPDLVASESSKSVQRLTEALAAKLVDETGVLTKKQQDQLVKFQAGASLELGVTTKDEARKMITSNASKDAQDSILAKLQLQDATANLSTVEAFFESNKKEEPKLSHEELSKSILESFGKMIEIRGEESVSRGLRFAMFQNVVLKTPDVLAMTKDERELLYTRIEDEMFTEDSNNKRDRSRYETAKEALENSIEDRQQSLRQNHLSYFETAAENTDTAFSRQAQKISLLKTSDNVTEQDLAELYSDFKSLDLTDETIEDINKAHRNKIIQNVFASYTEKGIDVDSKALEELTNTTNEDIQIQMTSEGHFTLIFEGKNANANIIKLTQAKDHNGKAVTNEYAPDAAANTELGLILLNNTDAEGNKRAAGDLMTILDHEKSHLNRELIKKSQEATLHKEVSRILLKRENIDETQLDETIKQLDKYYRERYKVRQDIINNKYSDALEEAELIEDAKERQERLKEIWDTIKQETDENFNPSDIEINETTQRIVSKRNQIESLFYINIESTETINEQDTLIDELSSEILTWDPTTELKLHHAGIEKFNPENDSHQAVLNFISFLNNNKSIFKDDPALKEVMGRIVEGSLLYITTENMDNMMKAFSNDNNYDFKLNNENIDYDKDTHTDNEHLTRAKDDKQGTGWEFSEGDIRRAFSYRYNRIMARNPYFRERGSAEPAWWDITGGKLTNFRAQRGPAALYKIKTGKKHELWDEVDLGLRMFPGRFVKHPTGKRIINWVLEKIFKVDKKDIKFNPYKEKTLSLQRATSAEHIATLRNSLSMMLSNSGMAKTQLLETLNNVGIAYADHYRGSIEARDSIWTSEQDEHRQNKALYHFLMSKNLTAEEVSNISYLDTTETQTVGGTPHTINDPSYIKKGTMTDSIADRLLMIMSLDGEGSISKFKKPSEQKVDFDRLRDEFREMSEAMMKMDRLRASTSNNKDRYTIEHLLRDIKATDDINSMHTKEWNGRNLATNREGAITEEPHDFVDEDTPGEIANPRKYIWIGGKKPGSVDTDRFLVEDARKFASYFMMAKAYNVLQAGSYGNIGSIKIERGIAGHINYTSNTTIYRTKQELINAGHPTYTSFAGHAEIDYTNPDKPRHKILIQAGGDIPSDGNIPIIDAAGNVIGHENLFDDEALSWFKGAAKAQIEATLVNPGDSISDFKLYADGANIIAENETMGTDIPIKATERYDITMMERFFGKIGTHGGERYIESQGIKSLPFYYYDWMGEKAESSRFYTEFQHRLSQTNTARDRAQNMKEMWEVIVALEKFAKYTILAGSLLYGAPALLIFILIWMATGSRRFRKVQLNKEAAEKQAIAVDEEYKQEAELWKKLGGEAMGTTDLEMMIGRHKRIRSRYSKIYKEAEDDIANDLGESLFAAFAGNVGEFFSD